MPPAREPGLQSTTTESWRRRISCGLARPGREQVSHPSHRADEWPAAALQLLSEMTHVHIERALVGCRFTLVKRRRQLVPGNDAAGGAGQQVQNVEFDRGDVDALVIAPDF